MKVAKNLFTAFIFFIIFFCIYFFRYLENYLYTFNIDVLKNFVINNIFSILFLSFLLTSIFIGVFNKKKNISNFITIIIFSIIALIYPSYLIFFNGDFNYTEYTDKHIIKDSNYLYKIDNYLIKANPTNNVYESSILVDTVYSNKLYFADNMLIAKNNIIMNKVLEISSNNVVNRDLVSLDRNNVYSSAYNIIENIVFGFNTSSYLGRLLKYISINNSLSIFFICILYAALFLSLLSIYMISSSLSFSSFKYHNMLLGFIIYISFEVVFFFIRFRYSSLVDNYINFSIFLCVLSLIIIVLSLVINIFMRNNKRMEE